MAEDPNKKRRRTLNIGYDVKVGPVGSGRDWEIGLDTPGEKQKNRKVGLDISTKGKAKLGPLNANDDGKIGISLGKNKRGRHTIKTSSGGQNTWGIGGDPKNEKFATGRITLKTKDSASGGSSSKKSRTMTRSEAASVAARARWAGKSKKGK